uniref:3-beta hydroxysteroid dehydrogenase/isomerase domain-containing protein n=1 Tax=Moniliophthora roreri TaxID=221103 RepID=A0A0W0EV46_MONRR
MAGLYRVFEDKKTHFQIGDNNNLFDWTYVGNVAHAHLLAADKLDSPPPAPPLGPLEKLLTEPPKLTEAELDLLTKSLSPIDLTVGKHRIPTSEARPLGPYVTPPPNAEKLVKTFEAPEGPSNHPVVRTRFDQLSENSIARAKLNDPEIHPLQVSFASSAPYLLVAFAADTLSKSGEGNFGRESRWLRGGSTHKPGYKSVHVLVPFLQLQSYFSSLATSYFHAVLNLASRFALSGHLVVASLAISALSRPTDYYRYRSGERDRYQFQPSVAGQTTDFRTAADDCLR